MALTPLPLGGRLATVCAMTNSDERRRDDDPWGEIGDLDAISDPLVRAQEATRLLVSLRARTHGAAQVRIEAVAELRAQGMYLREIADALGVSIARVHGLTRDDPPH